MAYVNRNLCAAYYGEECVFELAFREDGSFYLEISLNFNPD
jgi:hypothetical protein